MADINEKLAILETMGPLYSLCAVSGIFNDSKTIVDMPLRGSPDLIIQHFEDEFGLMRPSSDDERGTGMCLSLGAHKLEMVAWSNLDKEKQQKLRQFIDRWFLPPGNDTQHADLSNRWPTRGDQKLQYCTIQTSNGKMTADALTLSMLKLCRMARQTEEEGDWHSSLIRVPYPFIIPGERFRESYYWDSYWIIKGLLKQHGWFDFCLGIVRNFAYMVEHVGMVPNGFRSYYLNRSQPPMLTCMVFELYNHAPNKADVISEFLQVMKQELLFWRGRQRTLSLGNGVIASRYYSNWINPRPESLKEDLSTFESLKENVNWAGMSSSERNSLKSNLFRNISAAAESGWDFSSRWFVENNDLRSIRTTRILPVDLNAILMKSERLVSVLAQEAGDHQTHKQFRKYYRQRKVSFSSIFWDDSKQKWRDILLNDDCSIVTGFSRQEDYASDWVPLWCLDEEEDLEICLQAIGSLKKSKINALGGIAASSIYTGQQWDWPNVWPPLQYFLAEGCWSVARMAKLHKKYLGDSGHHGRTVEIKKLGDSIKDRYLSSAEHIWNQKRTLPEKFDCEHPGEFGYGGEYECVEGFGWTTGLALHWLE